MKHTFTRRGAIALGALVLAAGAHAQGAEKLKVGLMLPFSGTYTALGVAIEVYPTHIAGLPVAVNINCHATRHKEITL